jgi:transposase
MEDIQEELSVFQKALQIESPWYVSYHELDHEQSTLHIGLNFKRGSKFPCSKCGKLCSVYDVADENRIWRHLDFWKYKTILHARYPRTECKDCDKILTVERVNIVIRRKTIQDLSRFNSLVRP